MAEESKPPQIALADAIHLLQSEPSFLSRVGRGLVVNMKRLFEHLRSSLKEALSEEPMYEMFGPTLSALMSAFTFAVFMAGMAVEIARRWQSPETVSGPSAIVQFPVRSLFSLGIVALWLYGLAQFFRLIGWPKWWVLPYVLVILCPWAWVFARRIEVGGDFVALTLLQSPVVVAYVLQMRKRYKGRGY